MVHEYSDLLSRHCARLVPLCYLCPVHAQARPEAPLPLLGEADGR